MTLKTKINIKNINEEIAEKVAQLLVEKAFQWNDQFGSPKHALMGLITEILVSSGQELDSLESEKAQLIEALEFYARIL